MTTGTVKFFNPAKNFGFITPEGGGKDVFLPSSSISAGDVAKLKTGTRVSFDCVTDVKGEKAVNLKLLGERSPAPRVIPTIYFDPAAPETQIVKEAVRSRNPELTFVDYTATPLTVDQLKQLAALLSIANQSLVRRYHPMYLELRLDDRFIAESEYWTAVAEHPALINGPVVVAGTRASICTSVKDVASFFDQGPKVEPERKPKQISARLAAMMLGSPPGPSTETQSARAALVQKRPTAGDEVPKNAIAPTREKSVSKVLTAIRDRTARKSRPAQKRSPKPKAKQAAKKPTKKALRSPAIAAKGHKSSAKKKKRR